MTMLQSLRPILKNLPRSWKKLPRFWKNLLRFLENLPRFLENLLRFLEESAICFFTFYQSLSKGEECSHIISRDNPIPIAWEMRNFVANILDNE